MFELLIGLSIAGLVGYFWRKDEKKLRQAESNLDALEDQYETLLDDYNALQAVTDIEGKRLRAIQAEIAKQLAAVNAPDTGGL